MTIFYVHGGRRFDVQGAGLGVRVGMRVELGGTVYSEVQCNMGHGYTGAAVPLISLELRCRQ